MIGRHPGPSWVPGLERKKGKEQLGLGQHLLMRETNAIKTPKKTGGLKI
jgi:hypothetical protein